MNKLHKKAYKTEQFLLCYFTWVFKTVLDIMSTLTLSHAEKEVTNMASIHADMI